MINSDRVSGNVGVNTTVEVPSLGSQAMGVLNHTVRICETLGYSIEERVPEAPQSGNKVDILSEILSTIESKLKDIEASINRL